MTISLVENNTDLGEALSLCAKQNEIAVDLEFDKNFYRYGFNLCLMQIAIGEKCFLVDPLSDSLDVKKTFPLLENPSVQKVVFAFGEDLRLLHSLGCFPKNVYDLSIAAALLNYPPASLTNLLLKTLNIESAVSTQKSNWFERPLSENQKTYAAEDVLFLLELKQKFEKEASDKNITDWIAEENASHDVVNYSRVDNNDFLKHKDKKDFTEMEWYRYKLLMEYREELSKELNRPGYKVFPKKYLKEIAQSDRALMHWENVRGLHPKIKNEEIKNRIHQIWKKATNEADEKNLSNIDPAHKPLSPGEYERIKQEKNKINRLKQQYIDPIKKKIKERYGEETATFIFSNRIVSSLITDPDYPLASYKRKLLSEIGGELGLDVRPLLEEIEKH